jgi:phage-related protein
MRMKLVLFLGDSLRCLRDFPADARQDAGYQLDKAQRGLQPDDFKPMPTIGKKKSVSGMTRGSIE